MRRFLLILIVVLTVFLSGCSSAEDKPETSSLVDTAGTPVTAVQATQDGGLLYATQGEVRKVNKDGGANQTVASVNARTITGLTVSGAGIIFIAYTDAQSHLDVARVDDKGVDAIWQSPVVNGTDIAGRLAYTSYGRVVISIGQVGDAAINGTLLSLDPDGAPTQEPNVISTGWTVPNGIAYDQSAQLWVADNKPSTKGRIAREGQTGPTGQVTNFDTKDVAAGLSQYGTQEMAVCFGGDHELRRYLLSDGVEAIPERNLADDCSTGPTLLKDGRLAYGATTGGVRVTAF